MCTQNAKDKRNKHKPEEPSDTRLELKPRPLNISTRNHGEDGHFGAKP